MAADRVRAHVLAIDKEVLELEKRMIKLQTTVEDSQEKIREDEKELANARLACQKAHENYLEAWKVHNKIKKRQAAAVRKICLKFD
jgi:hypothetical protein